MRLGCPPTHVQSHFAEQRLSHHHVYAVNASEVHACDTLQFAAQIEAWSIGFFVLSFCVGGWIGRGRVKLARCFCNRWSHSAIRF